MQLLKGAQCTPTAEVEHVRVSQKKLSTTRFSIQVCLQAIKLKFSNWKWTKSTCHKMDDINLNLVIHRMQHRSISPALTCFFFEGFRVLKVFLPDLCYFSWFTGRWKEKTTWTGASDFPKRHSGPSRSFLLRKALQPQSEGTRSKGQQVWQHTAMVSSIWATAFI